MLVIAISLHANCHALFLLDLANNVCDVNLKVLVITLQMRKHGKLLMQGVLLNRRDLRAATAPR